ncbi:MAG: SCO6880 family protein [Acidimicrobiales bacterium]
MADEHNGRSYVLEPLDTSGVFLGLSAVQCALIGGGITLAVLMVTAQMPALAAAVPVGIAGAVSFGRARGHPAWQWLPLGMSWLWATGTRGRRWTALLPLWPTDDGKPAQLPACLAGLDIIEVAWQPDKTLGAVRDRHGHALTAIVPIRGPEFVLQPPGEQDRLVVGWADVLGQLAAADGLAHVSWSMLARPSGMEEHRSWLRGRWDGDLGNFDPGYDELVDVASRATATHDATVSLTVDRDKVHRLRTEQPASSDPLGYALVVAVESLLRSCQSAGLQAEPPLDPPAIHRLVRTWVDPSQVSPPGRLGERLGLVSAAAGPLVMDTAWDRVRIDGAWHRTYWVASWPRLHVPASWLEPFLSAGQVTRAMTVVFVPVSSYQSRRRIQRDLVKLESDAATKEEKGRRVDARHHRATQALLDREQELVAGYVEMAYVGLVTVSATFEAELEDHAAVVEQLAREAAIDLRPLDGRQDIAWAAALPLGLAPRSLLAG